MLTEAAKYFSVMFSGKYREGHDFAAFFPEDDRHSWEVLVQWCYTGILLPLEKPTRSTIFNEEATKHCWVRLKLCCLAEKYNMVLLQNLAMDSIIEYLQAGEPGLRLTFDVFSKWCSFVFKNTSYPSPIRTFMTFYFHYALWYNDHWATNPAHYDLEQMYDLATKNPDLVHAIFTEIRLSTVRPSNGPAGGPWQSFPCDFHAHLKVKGDCELECPESLGVHFDVHGSTNNRVLYYLKTMTLKGTLVCYVSQCAGELGVTEQDVEDVLIPLIEASTPLHVAVWVEVRKSFELCINVVSSKRRASSMNILDLDLDSYMDNLRTNET